MFQYKPTIKSFLESYDNYLLLFLTIIALVLAILVVLTVEVKKIYKLTKSLDNKIVRFLKI